MNFPFGLYTAVVCLIGILIGCSIPQNTPTTVIPYPISFIGAQTRCDLNGRPFILIHPAVLEMSDTVREGTLIHENVHVRQLTRQGCFDSMKRANWDKAFIARQEIEAYCTEFEFLVSHGSNRHELVEKLVGFVHEQYLPEATESEIRNLIFCGGDDARADSIGRLSQLRQPP